MTRRYRVELESDLEPVMFEGFLCGISGTHFRPLGEFEEIPVFQLRKQLTVDAMRKIEHELCRAGTPLDATWSCRRSVQAFFAGSWYCAAHAPSDALWIEGEQP